MPPLSIAMSFTRGETHICVSFSTCKFVADRSMARRFANQPGDSMFWLLWRCAQQRCDDDDDDDVYSCSVSFHAHRRRCKEKNLKIMKKKLRTTINVKMGVSLAFSLLLLFLSSSASTASVIYFSTREISKRAKYANILSYLLIQAQKQWNDIWYARQTKSQKQIPNNILPLMESSSFYLFTFVTCRL